MPEFRRIPVIRVLVVALVFSSGALAQDPAPPPDFAAPLDRGELGIRYWLSTGENKHAHNAQGLVAAYVAGIPFFQWTVLGTLFYSALLFGGFALLRRNVPALRAQTV